ncbi:hypothetical protein BpHYR1_017157 [Brachionus plicatilis]|uniref:Uncharacterized protein n=1 Tax=Brachionus plicatilis TaxID=10195 RepID=A0A3M7SRX7_BRAPC|nr:hypothetical protein BpHYR1_017157 [Brachionus plicatilis]
MVVLSVKTIFDTIQGISRIYCRHLIIIKSVKRQSVITSWEEVMCFLSTVQASIFLREDIFVVVALSSVSEQLGSN